MTYSYISASAFAADVAAVRGRHARRMLDNQLAFGAHDAPAPYWQSPQFSTNTNDEITLLESRLYLHPMQVGPNGVRMSMMFSLMLSEFFTGQSEALLEQTDLGTYTYETWLEVDGNRGPSVVWTNNDTDEDKFFFDWVASSSAARIWTIGAKTVTVNVPSPTTETMLTVLLKARHVQYLRSTDGSEVALDVWLNWSNQSAIPFDLAGSDISPIPFPMPYSPPDVARDNWSPKSWMITNRLEPY